jgi:hypothetical protein
MDHSLVYIELEAMIEKDWLVKSLTEFEQQLDRLVQERRITPEEHASLLRLYIGRSSSNVGGEARTA